MSPRLPQLPGGAYAPPAAVIAPPAPPVILGSSDTSEAVTAVIPWPINKEVSVFKSSRRWRACDVYVEIPPALGALGPFTVTAFVWAFSRTAGRSIVASGRFRYNGNPDANGALIDAHLTGWIAAARAVAEQYEVTVHFTPISSLAPPPPGQLSVTVACSDEMVQAPARLGAIGYGPDSFIKFRAVQMFTPPRLEVVGVQGLVTDAGPAFLQLYDCTASSTLALAGLSPRLEWPLGAAVGQGVSDFDVQYRCNHAPFLAVSSTPGFYTDPGSNGLGYLWVR